MPTPPLHVFIRNRDTVIFDEDILSLTSINEKGKFDILPLHSNFISLIEQKLEIEKINHSKQVIQVSNGILRVIENRIEIYIGVHR